MAWLGQVWSLSVSISKSPIPNRIGVSSILFDMLYTYFIVFLTFVLYSICLASCHVGSWRYSDFKEKRKIKEGMLSESWLPLSE